MVAVGPITVDGVKLVIIGGGNGGPIVNVTAFEVAPFRFSTVTETGPVCVSSVAGIVPFKVVAFTNVVAIAVPLKTITEPCTKPVPVAVIAVALLFAGTVGGLTESNVNPVWIVKFTGPATAPSGFVTVTGAVPTVAIRLAGTSAFNVDTLTNVVCSVLPLNEATAPARKPVPFSVMVNPAPPAVAAAGLIEVSANGFTVNGTGSDAVESRLITTTGNDPGTFNNPAGRFAVIWVALINIVVSAVPLNETTAPGLNPLPYTPRLNDGAPALTDDGFREMIKGLPVTTNGNAFVGVPSGLVTDTERLPA